MAARSLVTISFNRTLVMGLLCGLLTACAGVAPTNSSPPANSRECTLDRSRIHEGLLSTLWVQTSAEYMVSTRSVYAAAVARLDQLLQDSNHTAAIEQQPPYAHKPPAIIMDVDETVLDNSPFQAQLVLDGATYSKDAWKSWVDRAGAKWVPGASEFIKQARDRDIVVIFVTNRTKSDEERTRENFRVLNMPLPSKPDTLLTRNERSEWTSDKRSRREYVAGSYRILMLMGDDLDDFYTHQAPPGGRRSKALMHVDRFGKDWFLLPNPNYGSWERALFDSDHACDALDQRRQHLDGTHLD